jgi:hypothetical protein
VRRNEAAFYSAMALIMVGVLALVSLPLLTNISTESSSAETPACQGSIAVLNGTGGYPNCLQLKIGANSTTLSVGQRLRISVDLVNTLPYANNITTGAMPPGYGPKGSFHFGGFPIFTWPGCVAPYPLQFIVVNGNYAVGSLPAADPDYVLVGRICMEGQIVTQFAFGPEGDRVKMTAVTCIASCSPYPGAQLSTSYRLESDFTVMGYWNATYARIHPFLAASVPAPNGGDGSTYPYPEVAPLGQIAFVPGVYTLAVSSFWGQAEVIHFTVK